MTILLLITLASVIPDVYKSEESFGSCPKNEPFRMDDGMCLNFTNICIREENSQCKSVLNACSQCPPSGYTISMLATLNEKINELSTLRKEIKDIKNMSDSSRKQVELLPTLNYSLLPALNYSVLPALNYIRTELSNLTKEIKDIKNMSDSTRKLVELLSYLNDKINESKNNGIWLVILGILSAIEFVVIIVLVFQIVKHGKNNSRNSRLLQCISRNKARRRQSDSNKSTDAENVTFIKDQPGTSIYIPNKYLEDNRTKSESEKIMEKLSTQGQDIEKVFSKLNGIIEKQNVQIIEKMSTQGKDIEKVSSKLDGIIEKQNVQSKNLQNISNEDMKSISFKLEEIMNKLDYLEIICQTADGVPEAVAQNITRERCISE